MRRILSVFVASLLIAGSFSNLVQALPAAGDGLIMYGEGSVATPRYREYSRDLSVFGNELNLPSAANSVRWTVLKASPTRDEAIAAVASTNGVLYVSRWNGSSWNAEWSTTIGNRATQPFDVAYEQLSGEAVVVYSGNVTTTNELRYRTWNGTSWSSATNYNLIRTSGNIYSVKLASCAGSDNLALAWGDSNADLSASIWSGSSNTFSSEPSSAFSTNLSRVGTGTTININSFDIAFESVSKEPLLVWGNSGVNQLQYVTHSASALSAWNTQSVEPGFPEIPTDIELSPDPLSDYIGYVNASSTGSDSGGGMWNGTGWQSIQNIDTTMDTINAGSKNISAAWVNNGTNSRMVVVYDDKNASGIDWLYYDKTSQAWSPIQADFVGSPSSVGVNERLIKSYANPHQQNEMIIMRVDNSNDLYLKRLVYSGSSMNFYDTESGSVYENTVSTLSGSAADFAYFRNVAAGQLSLDIVDSSNMPIQNPGTTFGAVQSDFSCTSSSAVLGTPSAKIRITNTSLSPLWTVTIAPTNGASALWQGVTSTNKYDFNDMSGSPLGCVDGADSDDFAGLLTINTASASLTPSSGCHNSNLSLGSSQSFSSSVSEVNLLNAGVGAPTGCTWDLTNILLEQTKPSETKADLYTINMTITVTAS